MHKIPSGAKFIIAGNKYIRQLSKHVTSVFKLCYRQICTYHKKNKNIILAGPKPSG